VKARDIVASRLPIRRGLSEPEAALYVGIGVTKFREMITLETMPKPRCIGTRRLWDVDDLDAAFRSLPIEGEEETNSWDDWAVLDDLRKKQTPVPKTRASRVLKPLAEMAKNDLEKNDGSFERHFGKKNLPIARDALAKNDGSFEKLFEW